MKIQYYRKNVYGVEKMYVADERTSKLISALTHQMTLSVSHKLALEELGHEFEEVLAPIDKQLRQGV